ncbi:glucosyltransferase domain-containing protein [Maridesulfovibrio hydrothermalis]|uniref:Glucosyl transferase GtrII n=1 Tax=Maridesulfovibrio hydrothermalis AM13 = DSM 14728 TaxID=1121451 RepID=L0R9D7_9BACT|nr:glucosyltransferase domain-containing protein [Maridesulfovibrio hydrothermalis]CCO22196.1 membrane protein of unknown function [Maridesulfovibrio hydrothermalis AM13 = DSM 14728]
MQDLKITTEDKSFILLFAGLTLLYVLPMIIANCPYNDDYCRIMTGNSWDDDGRLLPSQIMRFLMHATTIYTPAPLPLLLSIPVFTFGGLLIKKLFIDVDNPYISTILAFGFIFNPFLLRLFIYQLDSLGLSLSLVLLIVPFALKMPQNTKKIFRYHAACALCIFLSINSYQASLGFFMALAVIEFVHSIYKNEYEGIFKTIANRILQLVLAFIAYKLFLKLFFIANIARRAAKSQTLDLSENGLHLFLENCRAMSALIFSSLSQQQIIFFSLLLIISIVFVAYTYKKNVLTADIAPVFKIISSLAVLAPLIIFSFSFIHMAVIKESFKSSLQVLTSFSGITAFLFLVPGWAIKNKKILCWLLAPVMLSGLGFSYLAGNLVKVEHDYHQPIISSIVSKINDATSDKETTLYYSGNLQNSHYFHRLVETFPIFRPLDTNAPWAFKYQLPYYGCGVRNYRDIEHNPLKTAINTSDLPLIADTFHYTLYKYNSDLLLIFKKP